jgi:putative oxidoreductase
MKFGRLLLRATVGGLFVGHGTQKLFGWFGGGGLGATAEGFGKLGLHPPRVQALAAGAAEAGGGAGIALGFATPASAAVLVATMLTAINRVHLRNGPWLQQGGYEYNVVLIAAALAIAELGPGRLSLDAALGRERSGAGWMLATLAAGVAGATGAHLASETLAPEDGAPADGAPEDGAPADGAPADGAPADGAPADGAPTPEPASADGAPAQEPQPAS